MARLKGKNKLNNAVATQLAPFGITNAFLDTDYAYYWQDEKVSYKITHDIEDEWFCEFIEERFGLKVKYPMVMALLHEIGHHMTDDDLGDAVQDFCIREKERIESTMGSADDEFSKVLEWQYFNLPDEILATSWAVDYTIAHPRKVAKMAERLATALADFYALNGVEV